MRRLPEAAGASAEVYNMPWGWLTGRIADRIEARGTVQEGAGCAFAQPLERLKKEKLVRRSQKNESGKVALISADEAFQKARGRLSVCCYTT